MYLVIVGHTFYFRYKVFHVRTWLPLFQIWPPISIARHTFCNSSATPTNGGSSSWPQKLERISRKEGRPCGQPLWLTDWEHKPIVYLNFYSHSSSELRVLCIWKINQHLSISSRSECKLCHKNCQQTSLIVMRTPRPTALKMQSMANNEARCWLAFSFSHS